MNTAPTQLPVQAARTIQAAVLGLRRAALIHVAGKIDFRDAVRLDVIFSDDEWTPFEGMSGFETRISERDNSGLILALECAWHKSSFFPPHYHEQEETIHVLSGLATFFLDDGSGEVSEVDLSDGDVLRIKPNQAHAGYVHGGTNIVCTYRPPIPQANACDCDDSCK